MSDTYELFFRFVYDLIGSYHNHDDYEQLQFTDDSQQLHNSIIVDMKKIQPSPSQPFSFF